MAACVGCVSVGRKQLRVENLLGAGPILLDRSSGFLAVELTMQKSDQGQAGRIFLSYRRQDDPGFTNAIFQRLELAFGRARLFMDTGGYLQLGENFILALEAQVASCDVLLAIIGPRWLQTLKERDASTADFVAIEIQAALG
jgi:hypothetical protein